MYCKHPEDGMLFCLSPERFSDTSAFIIRCSDRFDNVCSEFIPVIIFVLTWFPIFQSRDRICSKFYFKRTSFSRHSGVAFSKAQGRIGNIEEKGPLRNRKGAYKIIEDISVPCIAFIRSSKICLPLNFAFA